MSDNGWIKLYRKLQNSKVWSGEPFSRGQAWVDLLLLANHCEASYWSRGIRVTVKRGEVGHSEVALSERWSWSRGKVRRFLKWLENAHQIAQQKTNVTTVLAITNYEEYQGGGTPNGTPSGTADGHQTDTRRTPDGHKQEERRRKKKEKKTPYSPPGDDAFVRFWNIVHLKVGKEAARKAFKRAITKVKVERPDEDPAEYLCERMAAFAKTTAAHPTDHSPVHPSTWLNAGRYDDDPQAWGGDSNGGADDMASRVLTKEEIEMINQGMPIPEEWSQQIGYPRGGR